MHKPAITIGILTSGLLLSLLFYPNILRLLGYYVTTDQTELAQYLIDHQLPASDCHKLIHLDRFGPPISEKRLDCIVQYGIISEDPHVCERLMPSQFGLECISSIWGPLTDESNCHWYENNAVRCFEGEKLIPKITTCTPGSKELPDECLHRIAFKNKDPSMCDSINNPVLQSVCEVRINTWNQFPEVRSTMYFSMP